jgi:hypothetical protein
MTAETIAGALKAYENGVVQQAVEQRGSDDGVAEHLALFGKAAVGGKDHGELGSTKHAARGDEQCGCDGAWRKAGEFRGCIA